MDNIKDGLEHPKGAECSLSLSPGLDQDPNPSGDSYLTRLVSDCMQFGNHTLRPSGETAVAGSGLGWSLVSSPQNRLLEKAGEDERGHLYG